MTPPRASTPKPSRRVTKKMWCVSSTPHDLDVNCRVIGNLPDATAHANFLKGQMNAQFYILPVLVTYTTPLKRTKAREGKGR